MGEKQAAKEETVGGRDRPCFWTRTELLPSGIYCTAENAHKRIVSSCVCMYDSGRERGRLLCARLSVWFRSADIVASRPRVELQECCQAGVDIAH